MKRVFAALALILVLAASFMAGFYIMEQPEKKHESQTVKKVTALLSPIDQTVEETAPKPSSLQGEELEEAKRKAMHLDQPAYEQVTEVKNPDSVTILVNKHSRLPDHYAPNDLVPVTSSMENGQVSLRQEAAEAFEALVAAADQESIILSACSSFRSQDEQEALYQNGLEAYGQEYADAYWTRPGFSEHQTGLAVDIRLNNDTSDLDAVRNYPEDYDWLVHVLPDYGYIVRYGDDKEEYTLIAPESWHLRYVGKELAKYLSENNLSLDEYYGLLALNQVPDFTK